MIVICWINMVDMFSGIWNLIWNFLAPLIAFHAYMMRITLVIHFAQNGKILWFFSWFRSRLLHSSDWYKVILELCPIENWFNVCLIQKPETRYCNLLNCIPPIFMRHEIPGWAHSCTSNCNKWYWIYSGLNNMWFYYYS